MTLHTTLQIVPNCSFAQLMTAVLEKGAAFNFQAKGGSMWPFIHSGDVITITQVNSSLHIGQIVAFTYPDNGRLAVHRVICAAQDRYFLRGDNCSKPDGWIPAANIIGYVIRIKHKGHFVTLGLGVERKIISYLSRYGLLQPLIRWLRIMIRPFYHY